MVVYSWIVQKNIKQQKWFYRIFEQINAALNKQDFFLSKTSKNCNYCKHLTDILYIKSIILRKRFVNHQDPNRN